jgi:hypothetical protein
VRVCVCVWCGVSGVCTQADILVSELLGSFGDNELSPECLDGAQRFLKEGGVRVYVCMCVGCVWVAFLGCHTCQQLR